MATAYTFRLVLVYIQYLGIVIKDPFPKCLSLDQKLSDYLTHRRCKKCGSLRPLFPEVKYLFTPQSTSADPASGACKMLSLCPCCDLAGHPPALSSKVPGVAAAP